MAGKHRAVVICHPLFDQAGKTGIVEAKEFTEELIKGQNQIIEMAEKSGEAPEKILQIRQHVASFQFLIRNLDKDLL